MVKANHALSNSVHIVIAGIRIVSYISERMCCTSTWPVNKQLLAFTLFVGNSSHNNNNNNKQYLQSANSQWSKKWSCVRWLFDEETAYHYCCCFRISWIILNELQNAGVSIKIEVASCMDRVTDCINKGPLVPFSTGGGGGSKRVWPQKILKFQSPKKAISSVLGTKFVDKMACFSFKKMLISSYQSHNQFLRAMDKWWKLNYVLLRVNKFCVNL